MKGLSNSDAAQLLLQHGKNVLETRKAGGVLKMLSSQFTDILVLILLGAAAVSWGFGHHEDAYVIFGIVFLNAAIGFIQEFRTEKTLEALKKMVHPEIRVIRDGEERLMETENLVPGDLVVLAEGDKIPADGVLKVSHGLKVEESALTGESLPVEKNPSPQIPLPKGERLKDINLLFMGTSVSKGSGIFQVTYTGMKTRFGRIAELTTQTDKTKSPLQLELEHIGRFVLKVTFVIGILLVVIGRMREYTWAESILFSVSVAIAAVPEGLPTTVTIALALGATVLARKMAIIKKLSSVETLGAVTTICSDKTGTLTKNEMTVRQVCLADGSLFNVSGVGYDPHLGNIDHLGGNQTIDEENRELFKTLLEVCFLCNEAKLVEKENQYSILGDPTEGALLTLVEKAKHTKDFGLKLQLPNVDEIFPFDSDRKMMSVLAGNKVLVKGSPDQVLAKCTHYYDGANRFELDDVKRKQIESGYHKMAENALRVLAFAVKDVEAAESTSLKDKKSKSQELTETTAEEGLTFVGLVGMIDPPREEVKEAVKKCRFAGVRVVVITGDFGITAKAIARELGIVRGTAVTVLTGDELKTILDADLSELLADKSRALIFARSLPEQKMRIVKLLQDQGEIVAMTGDGVNDAPALKKANIGVAMGITGTEVSKEAATMILANDSFASIVTAIEEGRRIYENLRKFVWFIFSCNIGELFVIFAAILLMIPSPLTAILILCVDLGTDILPAIALGVDKGEDDAMKKPPRNPKAKVLNKSFVTYFLVTGVAVGVSVTMAFVIELFSSGWTFGDPLVGNYEKAQTVAFTTLVFVQLVNAFSARSFTQSFFKQRFFENHFLLLAIATSIMLVMMMIYIPVLNVMLGTKPLELFDWGLVVVGSLLPLAVVEIYKYIQRQKALKV